MLLSPILAEGASTERVLLVTTICSSLATLAATWFSIRKMTAARKADLDAKAEDNAQAIRLREQDRLDAEAKARGVLAALEAQQKTIQVEAAKREQRIVGEIKDTKNLVVDGNALTKQGIAKSVEALDAANGINAKQEKHSADTKAAIETVAVAAEKFAAAAEVVAAKPAE